MTVGGWDFPILVGQSPPALSLAAPGPKGNWPTATCLPLLAYEAQGRYPWQASFISPETTENKSYARASAGWCNCVSAAGQATRPTRSVIICGLKPCKRKWGLRKKRTRGKRAGKLGRRGKCERLRLSGISIGYCNIRGIRGSRYSLDKTTEAFDILLFQETKLRDGTIVDTLVL